MLVVFMVLAHGGVSVSDLAESGSTSTRISSSLDLSLDSSLDSYDGS